MLNEGRRQGGPRGQHVQLQRVPCSRESPELGEERFRLCFQTYVGKDGPSGWLRRSRAVLSLTTLTAFLSQHALPRSQRTLPRNALCNHTVKTITNLKALSPNCVSHCRGDCYNHSICKSKNKNTLGVAQGSDSSAKAGNKQPRVKTAWGDEDEEDVLTAVTQDWAFHWVFLFTRRTEHHPKMQNTRKCRGTEPAAGTSQSAAQQSREPS